MKLSEVESRIEELMNVQNDQAQKISKLEELTGIGPMIQTFAPKPAPEVPELPEHERFTHALGGPAFFHDGLRTQIQYLHGANLETCCALAEFAWRRKKTAELVSGRYDESIKCDINARKWCEYYESRKGE